MPIRWLTIFLDFPARDFDAGVAFWREVTGTGMSPPRGLADPTGRRYCLTMRDPATGKLR